METINKKSAKMRAFAWVKDSKMKMVTTLLYLIFIGTMCYIYPQHYLGNSEWTYVSILAITMMPSYAIMVSVKESARYYLKLTGALMVVTFLGLIFRHEVAEIIQVKKYVDFIGLTFIAFLFQILYFLSILTLPKKR